VCVCACLRSLRRNLANNSEEPKSTMDIRNCNLRRRQVRKRGTIGLNQSPTLTFTFYLPLLNIVANKNYSDFIYIYIYMCVCVCLCVRVCALLGVTWLITLGGQNRLWILGIVIYEGDK